ncbi:MAG: hypothetical protein CVU05_10930 [Bacteroidetes bacterium HGW-Bacteroidetes-21]|nr:MAG: hypothetical protein CVU05_10930 [Bacteroidetes bacterium HGW-Bacteroidetes-21]
MVKKTRPLRIIKFVNLMVWSGLVLMAFIPQSWFVNNGVDLCLHKLLTGYECPLCGMTRSTWSVAHFDFVKAIAYNPVIIPLLILQSVWTLQLWTRIKVRIPIKILLYIVLASFTILYIYRFTV